MNLFSSAEVAKNYIGAGKGKASMPIPQMILLGIMAGAFIAFAGIGSTTAAATVSIPSIAKLISACIFPAGLAMCVLTGAELFTGNCLMAIPLAKREITVGGMLKNWIIVWLANLLGGILVAALVVYGHTLSLFDSGLAVSVMSTAASKCTLTFGEAFLRGIGCNFLVCIAVWIANAAKDVAGKVIGLFFPIMLFLSVDLSTALQICIISVPGFLRKPYRCMRKPHRRQALILTRSMQPAFLEEICCRRRWEIS